MSNLPDETKKNGQRSWHWSDTAMIGLRSFWYTIIIVYTFIYPIVTKPFWVQVAWVALAFAVPQWFWRPRRMQSSAFITLELLLMGSFVLWTIFLLGMGDTSIYISALQIGYIANRMNLWWAAPAVICLEWLGVLFADVSVSSATHIMLNSIGLFAIGFGIKRLVTSDLHTKELLSLLENKNSMLTLYAERVEKVAKLEERNRMARELHDSLGHSLITVVVGLDVSILTIEEDPKLAKEKLCELREYTAETLDDVRGFLHRTAEEEAFLSEQLFALSAGFSKHSGMDIRFQLRGVEQETRLEDRLAFIRCAKEALSNAARHGSAKRVYIILLFTEKEVRLHIQDNGRGTESIQYGFGLQAMQDRLENMSGTLTVNSVPGKGFELQCCLPLRGEYE